MMYVRNRPVKNKRPLYTGRPIPAASSGTGLNASLASPAKSGGSSLGYTSKEQPSEPLFTRSEPYAADPDTGLTFPSVNAQNQGSHGINARQSSNVANNIHQEKQRVKPNNRRGYVDLSNPERAVIGLTQHADASTFLHSFGIFRLMIY